MAVLAPTYSSSRMAREYVEQYYFGWRRRTEETNVKWRPAGEGDAVLGASPAGALVGSSHRGHNRLARRANLALLPASRSPRDRTRGCGHSTLRRAAQWRAAVRRRTLDHPVESRDLHRVSAGEPASGGIHGANHSPLYGCCGPD